MEPQEELSFYNEKVGRLAQAALEEDTLPRPINYDDTVILECLLGD